MDTEPLWMIVDFRLAQKLPPDVASSRADTPEMCEIVIFVQWLW
jgi:hypothetical protein